jgi:hypothetical protein
MQKLFFSLVFIYGVLGSGYVAYETTRDMAMLENAVKSGNHHAEMRHRMNVAAEGNWFLLGNIIAITGAIGFCMKNTNKK